MLCSLPTSKKQCIVYCGDSHCTCDAKAGRTAFMRRNKLIDPAPNKRLDRILSEGVEWLNRQ